MERRAKFVAYLFVLLASITFANLYFQRKSHTRPVKTIVSNFRRSYRETHRSNKVTLCRAERKSVHPTYLSRNIVDEAPHERELAVKSEDAMISIAKGEAAGSIF